MFVCFLIRSSEAAYESNKYIPHHTCFLHTEKEGVQQKRALTVPRWRSRVEKDLGSIEMDAMHLDHSGGRDAKIPPEAGFGFCSFIFDRFGLGLDFCYLLWFLLVDFLRFCFISATHAPCVSWEKRLSETFRLSIYTFSFPSFPFSSFIWCCQSSIFMSGSRLCCMQLVLLVFHALYQQPKCELAFSYLKVLSTLFTTCERGYGGGKEPQRDTCTWMGVDLTQIIPIK